MSCDFNTDDDDVISIDDTVLVLVTEAHSEIGPPSVVVHFETENPQPCSNYQIQNDFSVEGEMIVSDFDGIFRPNACSEPEGPATSTNFTNLDNGEYLLEINYEGDTDLYNIGIAEDSITMDAQNVSFTRTEFDVSWRYRENSFAYLCGTADGSTAPCDGFEGILEDSLTLEEFTFPDRGYVPYPQTTVGFEYNAPGRFYSYGTPAVFEEVIELLSDYNNEIQAAQNGIVIFMINWEGRQVGIGR